MTTPTLRAVFDQLRAEGYALDENLPPTVPVDTTPWFVRALVGISAWVAAICLIGFVTFALSVTGQSGLAASGLLFLIGSVIVRLVAPRSVFVSQSTLATVIAGEALLAAGIGWGGSNAIVPALAIIIVDLVLAVVFPDAVKRFFAALAIPWMLVVLLNEWHALEAIHGLVALLAAATVLLWQYESRFAAKNMIAAVRPFAYGLPIALGSILSLSAADWLAVEHWWISSLVMLCAVVWVVVASQREQNATRIGWPVFAALVVASVLITIPALSTPGLLVGVLLLLLGFWRNDRLLLGLGVLAAVLFVVIFYYGLATTLLMKSISLMALGLMLLGIRVALPWVVKSKEPAQ